MNRVKYIALLFLNIICGIAYSQTPLRIQVQVTKPYPNKISDFQSNPKQVVIQITNTWQNAYQVQLIGSVVGDNNVGVRTSASYRSSRPIEVPPLSVKLITAQEIAELFNPNGLTFSGITRERAVRLNGLPEGMYQVCVRAIDYNTRAPLSDEEPFGCSNLFMVSNLEPPVIIKPFNDETIRATFPQNIIFSWSMPPGAPPTTQYNIRLVELPDANRNPFDVMRSSRQPFFETTVVGAPTLLYGPAQPPLMAGRKYALLVTASDPFGNVVFRNGGRSEVVAFTYDETPALTSSYFRDEKLKSSPINIPRTTIAGKIEWYFKASEEKSSPLDASLVLTHFSSSALLEAMLDPSVGPASGAQLQQAVSGSKVSQAAALTAISPKQSVVSSPRSMISAIMASAVMVSGAGTVTSVTSPKLSAASSVLNRHAVLTDRGSVAYPLLRTNVKVYAVSSGGKETLLTATQTDDQGNFEALFINTAFYNPALGDKLVVHVDHPDFLLQHNVLRLPRPDSTGRHDLGTLSAVARTFRFKPKVVDEEGKVVSDAVVELYRPVSYYNREPNHKNEGFSSGDAVTVNGQSCIKVLSVRSGQSGGKLFYSDEWTDQYIVKVVHERLQPLTSTLTVAADGSAREAVVTIEKTYNTIARWPTLKGRVSKRLQPIIHVSGATVTVHINDDAVYPPKAPFSVENIAKEYGKASMKQVPTVQSASSSSIFKATIGNANILSPVKTASNTALNSFVGATSISKVAIAMLANTRSTTTDSAGNFTFTNLPISAKYTKISVRIPGSDKVYYDSVLLAVKGKDIEKDLMLTMTVFTVAGVIKDESNQPIARPVLRWTSGGSPFEGDDAGRFVTTNTAGKDTLIVTKLGFEVKRVPVTLTEPPAPSKKKGNTQSSAISSQAWAQSVQNLNSFSLKTEAAPFTASGLGYHAVSTTSNVATSIKKSTTAPTKNSTYNKESSVAQLQLSPLYTALIAPNEQPVPPIDLGTIVLRKRVGRLLVKVLKEADNTPIVDAHVNVIDTPLEGQTNNTGRWYSEVPGGEVLVQIKGPAGSAFVAVRRQTPTSDMDTTHLEVKLKAGVVVAGTVRAGTQSIQDARVWVDGFEHIEAYTDAAGKYSVVVPQGEYKLIAAKKGYVGADKTQSFNGAQATVDFNLGQPGFDISTLLGFDVEIEKMEGTGSSRTLSGALTNLPSNTSFTVKPGTRIPFHNVIVDITDNVPVPRGGQIPLSITQLDLLAFDYLPLRLKNNDAALVIKQVPGNNKAGQLVGIPEINYAKFIPIPLGFSLPADAKHTVSSGAVVVLQSGSALPSQESLTLSSTNAQATLYGFNLQLNMPECVVKNDGLYFNGELNLSGVPLLNNSKLAMDELVLGKDGSVKRATVSITTNQAISLGGWGASLLSAHLNENGLKLSGNVKVTLPQSAESAIGFSNLAVSKTALYGGDFTLPAEGLDVFGIVKMKQGIRPLSFGRIGNTSVHYIGGSGEFKLPKFIDKTLSVEFFQIQTDGKFEAMAPANFNVPFLGIANITVRSIGFRTTGTAGIDIKGDFNLKAIPFFKASAGGIHFERNGSVSVEELGVGFDLVGIARLSARARFIDRADRKGFEGEGSIKINATPLDLALAFRYYKLPAGIEVGALLRVGVPIPIGIVTLADVEGEFGLNTQDKKWMGRIGCSMSIGALNAALAIKPLSITVENGPVFKLNGGFSVLGQTVAKAYGILDFPKSYFSLEFQQGLNFLPELVTVDGGGIVVISTAKNDTYWMMGARYYSTILGGLVRSNANITVGWGLNVDAHPEYGGYTHFINRNYLSNGTLKGIHVAAFSGINFDTGERGFEGVATGKAWYKNHGAVNIDMNFDIHRYGLRVAAGWEAGAWLKIADKNVAGVEAGISGELKGYYDYQSRILEFEGGLRAKLAAWIGDCGSGCETKICWGGCFDPCPWPAECEICPIPVGGKLCITPGAWARYNSANGFKFGINF